MSHEDNNRQVNKWMDTVYDLFSSEQTDKQHPLGEAPTIVFVGPTGSGKTALLNTLIGRTFLPEGTDHTTPVPTVLCHGENALIRALDNNAQPVSDLPKIPLFTVEMPQNIPVSPEEIYKTLNREESFRDIEQQLQVFWHPAFQKAREGKCHFIEIQLPLQWLPENVRIVDIPGYEGWHPEESPILHDMVVSWLKTADYSMFIMEKTKVLLGGGFKFINLPSNNVTLLVNQMDSFNPSQIHGAEKQEQAWDIFREKIETRLEEENISPDAFSILMGSARMGRRCKPWLEDRIHLEMGKWFQNFQEVINNVSSEFEERQLQEKKKKDEKFLATIRSLENDVKQTTRTAYSRAKDIFLSTSAISNVKISVANAIEKVDVGFTDLFSKEELAERFQKQIIKDVQNPLKANFEKAMNEYGKYIQNKLEDSLQIFFKEMSKKGVFIDQNRLAEQIGSSLGNVSGEVAGSLTVLLGSIVMSVIGSLLMVETTQILFIVISSTINPVMLTVAIVGALTTLVVGGKLFSIKSRVSKKVRMAVVPKFDKNKMAKIWSESTKNLNNTVFEAIWRGKDANGAPLYINGKRFEGIESIIKKGEMQL